MGKLFIVTGPSGAGKREVIARVKQYGLKICQVVTYTTRDKRREETAGEDYYYISQKEFMKMADENQFMEWTEVHDHLYGSKKEDVDKTLKVNPAVVLETDPVGARKIKKSSPSSVTIFIMPPSYEYLKNRLSSLSQEEIKRRIEIGRKELENLLDWDYLAVYEDGKLDQAAEAITKIIKDNL